MEGQEGLVSLPDPLRSPHRCARGGKGLLHYPTFPSGIQGNLPDGRGEGFEKRTSCWQPLPFEPSHSHRARALRLLLHANTAAAGRSSSTPVSHQNGWVLLPKRDRRLLPKDWLAVSRGLSQALPREAAWSRQFPSPVVARGSSRWQLGSTVTHQFRRPGEIWESVKPWHSTGLGGAGGHWGAQPFRNHGRE